MADEEQFIPCRVTRGWPGLVLHSLESNMTRINIQHRGYDQTQWILRNIFSGSNPKTRKASTTITLSLRQAIRGPLDSAINIKFDQFWVYWWNVRRVLCNKSPLGRDRYWRSPGDFEKEIRRDFVGLETCLTLQVESAWYWEGKTEKDRRFGTAPPSIIWVLM